VFKTFSRAVLAVACLAGSAAAAEPLDIAALDLDSIRDADNAVVETSFDLDVEALASQAATDQAIEAGYRRGNGCYGGYNSYGYGNYGGYNGGYNNCYGYNYSYGYRPYYYNYCYQPRYYRCRPVVYQSYCYPRRYWGCY